MLAERLKYWRKSKGYTQSELAGATGVSDGLIGQIETGKANPSVTTLMAIAKVLEISPGLLLDDPCQGEHREGTPCEEKSCEEKFYKGQANRTDKDTIELENLSRHQVRYKGTILTANEKKKLQGIIENALELKESGQRSVAASKAGAAPVDIEVLQGMIDQAVERAIQWREKNKKENN